MKSSLRNKLEKYATEELDKYLQYALAQENYSDYEDVIKTILDIVVEREKDIKPEITPGMWLAWEKYLKKI